MPIRTQREVGTIRKNGVRLANTNSAGCLVRFGYQKSKIRLAIVKLRLSFEKKFDIFEAIQCF